MKNNLLVKVVNQIIYNNMHEVLELQYDLDLVLSFIITCVETSSGEWLIEDPVELHRKYTAWHMYTSGVGVGVMAIMEVTGE